MLLPYYIRQSLISIPCSFVIFLSTPDLSHSSSPIAEYVKIPASRILPECMAGDANHCGFPVFVGITLFSQYSPEEELVPDAVEKILPRDLTNSIATELRLGSGERCDPTVLWSQLERASKAPEQTDQEKLIEQELAEPAGQCLIAGAPTSKVRALVYWRKGVVVGWAECSQAEQQLEFCELVFSGDRDQQRIPHERAYWRVDFATILHDNLHAIISKAFYLNTLLPAEMSEWSRTTFAKVAAFSKLKIVQIETVAK
ncbi:hypothetical protein G6N76_05315 [Rhizobium daejeonense]|uniref:Uncharacterized protein n=1 Tax=Rhizobium daejeonense TaxID=240521 RepID=A0A6M1RNF2_9HYPH|nr:hypothetical protein [Rhizobium daejeonense]NGO63084.1 hypothetical protein [Rhizobium daejeonense]